MDILVQLIQDTITEHEDALDCYTDELGCADDWFAQTKHAVAAEALTKLLIDYQAILDAGELPVPPAGPVVTPSRYSVGGKDWSLDDTLLPIDIDRILGVDCRVVDDAGKVRFSWAFKVDGEQCGIWDYKGVRWSGMGPREAFEKLGIKIVEKW